MKDPNQPLVATSLDHIIQSRDDGHSVRLGLTFAILAHVVFFVVNWPTLARSEPKAPEKQPPIVVLRQFEYQIPPTPPPQMEMQVPPTLVPVPDPNPDDPEIIREDAIEPADFEPRSWYPVGDLEVPDPPPDPVQESVVVGVQIEPPRKIVGVDPVYPQMALAVRQEGAVILSLVIGESGRVESVEVLRGLPYGLTQAAVDAAWQWVFEPSIYNGHPTSVVYNLTVHFRLN